MLISGECVQVKKIIICYHTTDDLSGVELKIQWLDSLSSPLLQIIKLQYNVAGFAPEEISVNISGNTLKMHAFHEESRQGHTTGTESLTL